MSELFTKYYDRFHSKYYEKIMNILKEYYPKEKEKDMNLKNKFGAFEKIRSLSSLSKLKSKSKSRSKSRSSEKEKIDFEYFLFDYVSRLILIYELTIYVKDVIWIPNVSAMQKHLHHLSYLKPLSNYYGNENTNYFQINPSMMIKVVNISDQEIIRRNVEISVFYREVKIAKEAAELGVGPKIFDVQIFVDSTDCKSYGILYMEYIDGINIKDYLEEKHSTTEIKKELEKSFMKLYQHNITLNSPHRRDIPCNILLTSKSRSKSKSYKVIIIDYTFGQYISDYVYQRNHERIPSLYLFTREDIYHTLFQYILHLYKKNKSIL